MRMPVDHALRLEAGQESFPNWANVRVRSLYLWQPLQRGSPDRGVRGILGWIPGVARGIGCEVAASLLGNIA